jgi:hypothetical protein
MGNYSVVGDLFIYLRILFYLVRQTLSNLRVSRTKRQRMFTNRCTCLCDTALVFGWPPSIFMNVLWFVELSVEHFAKFQTSIWLVHQSNLINETGLLCSSFLRCSFETS